MAEALGVAFLVYSRLVGENANHGLGFFIRPLTIPKL